MQNLTQSAPNGDALKLFRPSSAPALELCSHYESIVTPSPNKVRGSNFHLSIAEILKAKQVGKEIRPEMAGNFTDQCDWALQIVDEKLKEVVAIEQEVTLFQDEEFITSGTLDLVGWSISVEDWWRPHVIDWKTGQERDYWAQVSIYAVALLERPDLTGAEEIDLTVAFVDQERAFTETFSRDELRSRVDSLIEAIRDPASGYFINSNCGYCNLRDTCPAWAAERNVVAGFDPNSSLSLSERFGILKSDPEKLGRFITAFRRLKNMVEQVEKLDSVALGMIQSGATMPGLTTIKRRGTESIGAGDLFELILALKPSEMDAMLSVDLKEARKLWEKYMRIDTDHIYPFPERKIKVGEPTEYVALKK